MLKERNKKQKFLREQILDQGFEPEEFAAYLTDRREEGGVIRYERRCLGVPGAGPHHRRVQGLQASHAAWANQASCSFQRASSRATRSRSN